MNSFDICGAKVLNNALMVEDSLIISDLHFGYESSLNSQGFMIPQFQFEKIIDQITSIQDKACARNIILNGDIKHNFGKIDRQEWKEVLNFIDYLSDLFVEIQVIKGNHDNFTQYILDKRDIKMKNHIIIDNFYITHGHKLPPEIPDNIETIIIGHEHPCIGIRNGERVEKVKSYLQGTWTNYNLIVMPSFTPVSYGSDILHEKTISPFIKNVSQFKVYAIENWEVYPFGSIKDILSVSQEENYY